MIILITDIKVIFSIVTKICKKKKEVMSHK